VGRGRQRNQTRWPLVGVRAKKTGDSSLGPVGGIVSLHMHREAHLCEACTCLHLLSPSWYNG
jgi:hypothetical protein